MSIPDTAWWIVGLVVIQMLFGVVLTIVTALATWALARVHGLSIRVAELGIQAQMQASHVEEKLRSLSAWLQSIDAKLERLLSKNDREKE